MAIKYLPFALLTAGISLALNVSSTLAAGVPPIPTKASTDITDSVVFGQTSTNNFNLSFNGGYGKTPTGTSFSDTFSFALPSSTNVSGFIGPLSFNALKISAASVTNLSFSLFRDAEMSLLLGKSTPAAPFTVSGTQPNGTYYGLITGDISARNAGVYAGSVTGSVSPVPEPATYLMMLGGLAVVSFSVSRKLKKSDRFPG